MKINIKHLVKIKVDYMLNAILDILADVITIIMISFTFFSFLFKIWPLENLK